MYQLQVELSIHPLALQKFQRSRKHSVARGLGRQGDIQAAMFKLPLQLQMGEKSRFGLALTHGSFQE